MVVEKLAHELEQPEAKWKHMESQKAWIAKTGELVLMKPTTFMNESGIAVKGVMDFYKLTPEDVWVIHDDLDLPLGKIRIRKGGASAGHHGIDSVIKTLKSDGFFRIRLGIGRGKTNTHGDTDRKLHESKVVRFVLSRFGQSEAGELKHLVKHSVEAVRVALFKGLDKAMNQFN